MILDDVIYGVCNDAMTCCFYVLYVELFVASV